MPRVKKTGLPAQQHGNAKTKHKLRRAENGKAGGPGPRQVPRPRPAAGNTAGLVAKLDVPKISKHKTYFEFAENTDKKKKLEVETTDKREAPPGFTFVPFGNPELTTACKEISREIGAMIFIVSDKKEPKEKIKISDHVHRLGYHFRSTIVEQASVAIGGIQTVRNASGYELRSHAARKQDKGDPLPQTQDGIFRQADAAIKDLFPRIPNTDREMILEHAFRMGTTSMGKPVVGLQEELTLSRRVQLAVIAHVRHTHTRYDKLLRETDWATARAMVEPVCLDIIVKWRGDEETGRDQLDEVLREVVVISDSDDSDDDGDADESSSDDLQEVHAPSVGIPQMNYPGSARDIQRPPPPQAFTPTTSQHVHQLENNKINKAAKPGSKNIDKKLSNKAKKARAADRKGFKRYRAWNEALNRQKHISIDLDNPENQPQYSSAQSVPSRGEFADNRDMNPVSGAATHQRIASGDGHPGRQYEARDCRVYLAGANAPTDANHLRKVTVPERMYPEEPHVRQPPRCAVDPSGSVQRIIEAPRRPEPRYDTLRSPGFPLQDLLVPSIEKSLEGTVVLKPRQHYPMHEENAPIPVMQRQPGPSFIRPGHEDPMKYTDINGLTYKRQRIAEDNYQPRLVVRAAPTMPPARDRPQMISPQRHVRHASASHDGRVFVDLTSPQRGGYPYDRTLHEQPRASGLSQQYNDPRGLAPFSARPHEMDPHIRQEMERIRGAVSRNIPESEPAHAIARESRRPISDWQDRGLVSRTAPGGTPLNTVSHFTERISGAISSDPSFHSLSRRTISGSAGNGRIDAYPEDPHYGRSTGFVREVHHHPGPARDFREATMHPESPQPVFRIPRNPYEGIPQTSILEHQKHLPIFDEGAIPVRRYPDERVVRYENPMDRPQFVRQLPRRDVVVLD